MYIARWQFTSRFGKLDECISVLRKWEIDVGERIGWKADRVRIITGFIGGPETEIELEAKFENLTDFELVLGDMDKNPRHVEYMKRLENSMIPGTSSWSIHTEVEIVPR